MDLIKKWICRRVIFGIISGDILLLVFIIVLYIIGNLFFEPIRFDAPILFPIDSIKANESELINHNSLLLSTLHERESSGINSISSEKDSIGQTRNIYIGILGILLTIILSNNSRTKKYLIMLFIIPAFFALDIHLHDLLTRSIDSKDIISIAINKLVNQQPNVDTWYQLNYNDRDLQYDNLSDFDFRIPRKVRAIFHLDIFRFFFFIIPWFIIYFVWTSPYRKS